MLVVDKDQMIAIDKYAINELKIPALCLVERAALAVIKNINLDVRKSFAIVIGIGNNGADGLAVARNLLARDYYVDLYIIGSLEKASEEFILNYEAVKNLTENIYMVDTIADLEFMEENLSNVTTIIEGIFGTGLDRTISGTYAYVIALINRSLKYIISIDVPSGLDSTSGDSWGEIVDCDLIVSMQLMKQGVFERSIYKDKCVVEDIGIPQKAINKILPKMAD
ncbi:MULTISPECIES: NAD(P)H-hydrate epimerase [Anaerococcus]|uniref:NAD(P)H-hydrate epimerase n=1 Tax=Anaerococcus octavius TaxID=54007 RepID=A0A2I1M9B9_9FIRM|nr:MULTISPECIES: NAD(P)H-hydrate epimerase [Anaerococcus]MDU3177185.1 NAD(P)H-hydrate epimerase [Anaerococcus sp.]PKZ16735.1 NAD(P)H-hydrate epimerase [Anaerococcus octavius]